jgi:hypothetical protein
MSPNVWIAVTIICAIAGAGVAAAVSRRWSPIIRVAFTLLAALLTVGLVRDVRGILGLVPTDDDLAWSQIRENYAGKWRALGDVISLSPEIEKQFRAALLPIFRDQPSKTRAELDMAAAVAFSKVIQRYVLPVAAHGSTGTLNAWGDIHLPMLRQFADISTEACAEYATTSFVRPAYYEKVGSLMDVGYQALVSAYKTSNNSRYPLPDRDAEAAQYDKAARVARPPFSEAEIKALEDLDNQPKQRQCSLTLRLLEAIHALDASDRAIIFRSMMAKTN